MSVVRLRPLSVRPLGRSVGRCGACDKAVVGDDRAVRIYGSLFHQDCAYYQEDCAYYQARGSGSQRAAA